MDIKEQLIVLSEICRNDTKLKSNKEKLVRLRHESAEAKKTADLLEEKIGGLNDKKSQLLKRRRELDEKLQSEKGNLRKWESRAEKIKGEREYTALMSEISSQKRTLSGIEAEMSEIIDELKSVDESTKKSSGERDERVDAAHKSLESVKELLEEEEKSLQENDRCREELLEKIPKSLKMRYQRIYEKRSHQGVAFLRNEVCQACMRMVPPELFIRVAKGEVIEQCPSCQRILVVASLPEE